MSAKDRSAMRSVAAFHLTCHPLGQENSGTSREQHVKAQSIFDFIHLGMPGRLWLLCQKIPRSYMSRI